MLHDERLFNWMSLGGCTIEFTRASCDTNAMSAANGGVNLNKALGNASEESLALRMHRRSPVRFKPACSF
jgi:hypothetical protein